MDHLNQLSAQDTTLPKQLLSALDSFEQILDHAKGKKIALYLDYDGTLSPIVDDPDRAFMSDTMRSVVKDVAQYFSTSIISGRSRDKVYEFIKLEELHYAGSHGMDIMTVKEGQQDKTTIFQPASKFLPMIEAAFNTFVERTKRFEGVKVEDNKFCVSVHYRNAEKDVDAIKQCVEETLKEYSDLKLTYGKKVFEIRPVFDWNKGKAVEFLLESLDLSDSSEDVFPIYVGDDKTDEDAFKVLRERGQGYGILVSSVPKESDAFFSLNDPSEVMKFLSRLAKYGRKKQ